MNYFVNGFKGMEYCTEEDLVINEDMEKRGFEVFEVGGNISTRTGGNKTAYFVHPDLLYVYAECYFGKVDRYARLIIDKEMFYTYNLFKRAITLTTDKGCGNRCVPSISQGTSVDLHRLIGITEAVDHIWGTLNIVIKDSLRASSSFLNNKNKEQVDAIKETKSGWFMVSFNENKKLLNENGINTLKQMGYEVSLRARISISKSFETKLEALIAIKEYEDMFYKEFAYSIIKDMRGRFELKFQQLILGTMTEDDVIKTVLKEYAYDAYSVHRYNLIPLCEKYGIPYNEGITLPNGDLVNE